MAQHISPITPGAMANAGTSSRITPRKGGFFQKLGAGIETFVNTAAPMISPEVREFEKLRMEQEESGINQDLVRSQTERFKGEEERRRQEFERDNRFIDLDTALSTTTPSVRKHLEKEAEERLLSETDPNTGKKGVRFGAGAKFLEEFQKDPNKVLTLNRLAIQDHSVELSRIQKNIEKETNKMAKEIQSLDPGIGEIRAREMVQANMQNPANQSEELRRAFDDKNFINEKINALLIENESLAADTKITPSAKTAARETAFIPNKDGTFTMGFTNELTGGFEPLKGADGMPVKLTEKQVLLSQGKRAESLVDPFKVGFDTSAGREAGKLKIELETQIVKATQSNQTIQRGLDLLDSESGTFSGPLANIKVGFNKYLKEFGLNLTGEQVPNTEAFAAVMARDVINILGSGDLGAGTGISDNDRIFAAKIVGGDVTLDKNSIRKLLELNTKVNNAKITINNRRLESLQTQREASNPFAGQTTTSTRTESSGLTADQLKEKLRNR